jgi:V8-like Glu-specific endopeptidase
MRRLAGVVGVASLLGAVALWAFSASSEVISHPRPAPAVAPTRWSPAGALFDGSPDALGHHFCSASVIDSAAADVILTAAHCVSDGAGSPARTGMIFVPGYIDGDAPLGTWTVTGAVVDQRWAADGDPDLDVAFLTVERQDAPPIEDVTGGFHLVVDPGSVNDVQAIGYPWFSDAPLIRTGSTKRKTEHQLELDAPGLYEGTSGGPWVRDGDEVVGVTGGYEQGGTVPEVSYASYFDDATAALLAQLTER